jgi:hypothetical protein
MNLQALVEYSGSVGWFCNQALDVVDGFVCSEAFANRLECLYLVTHQIHMRLNSYCNRACGSTQ